MSLPELINKGKHEMTFNEARTELEPEARQEWDRDAALRSEFSGEFERYLNYLAATVSGRARISGSTTVGGRDV